MCDSKKASLGHLVWPLFFACSGFVQHNAGICPEAAQRIALAALVVLHASREQGAAMTGLAGHDFFRREPQGAHDASVKRPACNFLAHRAAKRKSQVGDVFACARPLHPAHVHAQQSAGLKMPGSFFQCLPNAGRDQAFARIKMPSGLVEFEAFGGVLFHQKILAALLDHGGRRHTRVPALVVRYLVHALHYAQRRPRYSDNVLDAPA
jgi:hypothetical protein